MDKIFSKDLPIPEKLKDKTTILETKFHKSHTWYTHLVCIFIRITLAILIASGLINREIIIILSIVVILIFGNKFINNPNTWKVYLRTVMAYTAVGAVETLNVSNANTISAGIIIADALMGLQSRYIASVY